MLVLEQLCDAGMKIKKSKCTITASEVDLLGYVVNSECIRAQEEKVAAIKRLQPPRSIKEIRSFLGVTGYYRTCIPQYAQENATTLRSPIFDRIIISVTKYDYFCKPIAITLNIILYEFNVSRVYGHTINLLPSEYINSETMSPILIFV